MVMWPVWPISLVYTLNLSSNGYPRSFLILAPLTLLLGAHQGEERIPLLILSTKWKKREEEFVGFFRLYSWTSPNLLIEDKEVQLIRRCQKVTPTWLLAASQVRSHEVHHSKTYTHMHECMHCVYQLYSLFVICSTIGESSSI